MSITWIEPVLSFRLDNAYATTEVLDASYVFSCSEADLLFRASHWRGCEVAVRLDRSIVPLFKNMDDVTESVDARGLLSQFEADLLFFRASHQPIRLEEWLRKQT